MTCEKCNDTGSLPGSDFLDCSCEVAQERIAIEREALNFAIDYKGGMDKLPSDLRWHFHQRARKIEREAQAQHNASVVKMSHGIIDEQAARIADLERQLSEHKAARIAYASEFQLDKNGDPDVGNIHANIRALKAQLVEASAPAVEQKNRSDHETAAKFLRQHDRLEVLKDGTVGHTIAVNALQYALSAPQADESGLPG